MKCESFIVRPVSIFFAVLLSVLVFHGVLPANSQAGDNNHPIGTGFIDASGTLPGPPASQHAIWFGDINNDSNLDVATAGYLGVRVWTGDGNGNWISADNFLPDNSYDGGICTGDINNDGNLDIAAANYDFGVGSVGVWIGDGAGSWTPASTGLPGGGWYTGIHLADINNDHKLDLAVGNENSGVKVYVGSGTGVWTDASTNLPTTGSYYSVWMDDVNHDNYTDLVAAGSGVHVWLGNGAGMWTEASNGLPWTDMWNGVTLGDINLDGHLDIAASMDMSGHGLRVWLGDGTSNWTASSTGLPTDGLYYGVVIADMVGDKYPELLVGGFSGTTAVEIWEGNGGFSWSKYSGTLPTGKIIGVAAGDINNDGYTDIGAAGEDFGVEVWKNDAAVPPLKVEVETPNGGEQWMAGSQHQVNWSTSGGTPPLTIRIEYSTTGLFGQYELVSNGEMDDGSFLWTILNTPSTNSFVRVNVTDSASLTNWDKSNLSFTILPGETTPPVISDLQPLNGSSTGNTMPTIRATYSDPSGINASSVILKVDTLDVTPDASVTMVDVSYTPLVPLSEGIHDIELEVRDDSINQNKATVAWWFRVDTNAPEITDELPLNQSTTGDSTPAISAAYSDPSGINLDSVVLEVDSVNITNSTTVTVSDVLYTPSVPLADGMHNVSLEVADESNPSNPGKLTWWFVVDTTVPDVTPPDITSLQPTNQSVIEDNSPVIGAAYDDTSGVNVTSVVLMVDSIDVTSSSNVTPLDVAHTPANPLTEGIHNVYLSMEDESSNRNQAEVAWWFEVNTMPPNITNVYPANKSLIDDDTPTVSASYDDGSGIDNGSVVLKVDMIDVTASATISSSDISYASATLGEGRHDVYLEVSDKSGLQKTTIVTWWFSVDTGPPVITNITPPDGSLLGDNEPEIGADFYDESGIDLFGILFNFEDSDSIPVPGTTVIQPTPEGIGFTPDVPLADDHYCAHLEVSDSAGNRAITDWYFSVDTTPPDITNLQPANESISYSATPVISASYDDASGINKSSVILELDSTQVTGSATVTETGVSFALMSGLSDGSHTIRLFVKDVAEPSNSAIVIWSFTIVTQLDDTDSDGLLDEWEMAHFGNLAQGPSNDTDEDGLTNLDEFNDGTDPNDEDTDDDGILDGNDDNPLVADVSPEGGVDALLLALIAIIIILVVILLVWFFVFRQKREEIQEKRESKETSSDDEEGD